MSTAKFLSPINSIQHVGGGQTVAIPDVLRPYAILRQSLSERHKCQFPSFSEIRADV